MINRTAVLLRPKAPYLTWARGLDDSGVEPNLNDERTVYLIPDYKTPEEAWQLLEHCFDEIFERELWAWHTDESNWPNGRDFPMFREWFEIEFNSEVLDLCDYEVIDDAEA